MPNMPPTSLLTLAEVAERVQLSTWAIRRAIDRGELRAFRPCGRIRIAESALIDWLDASSVPAATPPKPPAKSPGRRSTGRDTFRGRVRAQGH
jgi:excisionase family DNA binding protein